MNMTKITSEVFQFSEMTQEIADMFVNRILISENEQVGVEIHLNYSDELEAMLDEYISNEKVG